MITRNIQHIISVLKDWLLSVYLYQKWLDTIPVFIVEKIDFIFLDTIKSFFSHEKFILLTQDDIKEWGDVFCLKFLHMKNHSELFYWDDILSDISINLSDLRSAIELEIRNKRIRLREAYLSQNKEKNFFKYLLSEIQIIWEWTLVLKSPSITLPKDIKALLSLFDVAWSCNSQIFYYLLEDKVENSKLPSLIHDIHTYLDDVCIKVNDFTL